MDFNLHIRKGSTFSERSGREFQGNPRRTPAFSRDATRTLRKLHRVWSSVSWTDEHDQGPIGAVDFHVLLPKEEKLGEGFIDPEVVNASLDDCVKIQHSDCMNKHKQDNFWNTLTYFCGEAKVCRTNTQVSLDMAKQNVEKYFGPVRPVIDIFM